MIFNIFLLIIPFAILILSLFYDQVFSAFGPIQKIAMFDKNGGVQALIQYPGNL